MALRARERDPALPARAGEAHLVPPEPAELCALVSAHLARPGAPAVASASWDYARWKPGVSIAAVYTVRFADGTSEPVVAKRYADGKERTLTFRPRNEEHLEALCVHLAPRALLPEQSLALWVPPADRVLRGLPVLLDRKKLGNLVTRSGIAPPGTVKRRKTGYTLLRYKPERRAVYRLDLRLRGEGKPKLALAARALAPADAARVVAARTALEAAGGASSPRRSPPRTCARVFCWSPGSRSRPSAEATSATRARRARSSRACTPWPHLPSCASFG